MTGGPLEVAGVDLSLSSTGVTRLCWETNGVLYPFQRRITTEPADTLTGAAARLRKIADDVWATVCEADLIVIEGPAYGAGGGKAHERAGLWWMVVDALIGPDAQRFGVGRFGPALVVVTPSQRQLYAVGKGGGPTAAKDRVLAAVLRRYPPHFEVDGNDLADSTLLAAMGARALGRPVEDSLPQANLAAMTKVSWPDLRGRRE